MTLRASALALCLLACQEPVAKPMVLGVQMVVPDGGDQASATQLVATVLDQTGMQVAKQSFAASGGSSSAGTKLMKGASFSLRVEGLSASSELVAFGRTRFTVAEEDATVAERAFFGPPTRFAAFPKGPPWRRADVGVVQASKSGAVWIIGGQDLSSAQATFAVERFDARKLEFTAGPALAFATARPHVVRLNAGDKELALIAGGSAVGLPVKAAQVLDVEAGELGPQTSLITAREHAAVIPLGADRVLFVGGTGVADASAAETVTVDAEKRAMASSTPVSGLSGAVIGAGVVQDAAGVVYLVGGVNRQAISRFDPATLSFTPVAQLATVRTSVPSIVACGGRVIVSAGGSTAAESWTFGAGNVDALAAFDAEIDARSVCLPGDVVLETGRRATQTANVGGILFDPKAPAARKLRSFDAPRTDHALTVLADGSVLAIGGNKDAAALEIWVGIP